MIREVSKKRLSTNDPKRFIDVVLKYNKGGWGDNRGFYLSVCPIKIDGVFETYVGFSGYKHCVLPAERFSQKQANVAIEAAKQFENEMIERVCKEQNLKVQ